MSNYINRYKNRLKRNGNDDGEVYANNTIAFMEATFHASPSFRVLKVKSVERPEITEIDARVVEVERMGTLREVLFRPKQYLNVGAYVEFDGSMWIVSDLWGDKDFTNRALIQKCNHQLRWSTFSDWKDADGNVDNSKIINLPCLASQSPIGSKATQGRLDIPYNRYDVTLPDGQLFVYIERNDYTKEIKLNQRFIFGKSVYEVYGIDDVSLTNSNGFGIIQFLVKVTTAKDTDDFTNQVAFNKTEDSAVENKSTDNSSDGGRIW